MKTFIFTCFNAFTNAQFGGGGPASWLSWEPWQSCTVSCGGGTRNRLRACNTFSITGCPGGQSAGSELEDCNMDACPSWTLWGEWGDCSRRCAGGIKKRNRECQTGAQAVLANTACAGSDSNENQCNLQACDREMIYWNNKISSGSYSLVSSHLIPNADYTDKQSVIDECATYCLSFENCKGMSVTSYNPSAGSPVHQCYINDAEYTVGPTCWGTICDPNCGTSCNLQENILAVFKDYHQSNPDFLPTSPPDGQFDTNYQSTRDLCDDVTSDFGVVNYRGTQNTDFSNASNDPKNILEESSAADCASRCWNKAGCNLFFADSTADTCTFVFGDAGDITYIGVEDDDVTDSGILSNLCPTEDSISSNTFTKVSEWNCLVANPGNIDSIAQDLLQLNLGGSYPLREWIFEGPSGSPIESTSQYIWIDVPTLGQGYSYDYRVVWFKMETHVRVGAVGSGTGNGSAGRKRRSAGSETEPVRVGTLNEKADMKEHKKQAKQANQAAKQRNTLRPRNIGSIIDAVEEAEAAAANFILGGDLVMDGMTVLATGPVQPVLFHQVRSDGSVVADCSTGTCQCSEGFVDNGNGCEECEGYECQTITTTTTMPVTTTTTPIVTTTTPVMMTTTTPDETTFAPQNGDILQNAVDKMTSFFQSRRQGNIVGWPELSRKWNKFARQYSGRLEKMISKGCSFGQFDGEAFKFDGDFTCDDIAEVSNLFDVWGDHFTADCTKVSRGTEFKWKNRKQSRGISMLRNRTQQKNNC